MNHHAFETTPYYGRAGINHPEVKEEWVQLVIRNPAHIETQDDGRLKLWEYVEEAGTWLRVILEDRRAHNGFLDRNALR